MRRYVVVAIEEGETVERVEGALEGLDVAVIHPSRSGSYPRDGWEYVGWTSEDLRRAGIEGRMSDDLTLAERAARANAPAERKP